MAEATDQQMQAWSDQRTRTAAEAIRALRIRLTDDRDGFGSVFERISGSGGWEDGRTDGPPNLLAGSDLSAINTITFHLAKILGGGPFTDDADRAASVSQIVAQLPIVTKACVRPAPGGSP